MTCCRVLHTGFPHSIRFSADAVEAALKEIGGEISGRKSSRVERIAGRLRATLGFGQIDEIMNGGLHAYLDALLPDLGWVGFDPTNNLLVGERHIRTAVGRDYADVPPTKGIFKGKAASELTVSVRVAPSDAPPRPRSACHLKNG
jgi:transglutaminase-like putative cysteine protease